MPRIDPPRITSRRLIDVPPSTESMQIQTGPDHWYRYAMAFKRGADSLASPTSGTRGVHELMALPAMFLYRHYVELHLKSLLLDAGELLDDPQTVPPKHYLLSLWQRVRRLLLKIDPRSDGPWLERADGIITEFDALDPTSFAFRYPVDTEGVASLPPGFRVHPSTVTSVIEELHILLNGASTQIDVYMGYKGERY
jgi:hypothetical protein